MATAPKIRYDIEAAVSGGADVGALASQLEGLANTLEGDLKVQALASAQALRTLGEKQGAIENFVGLKTQAQAAADRLTAAQQAAQGFAREIATNGAPTKAQTGQLEKLRDAVRQAGSEMLQSRRSVEGAREALSQYGVATSGLSAQQRTIKAAIEEQRAAFDLLSEAARASAEERVRAENLAAAAAQAAAQKEQAMAAQRLRLIEAVAAANNRAVGQAKAAEQSRLSAATASQTAERARAEMIERYSLQESLSRQAMLARLEAVRAQYPRLGAAAQASGTQQAQAARTASAELNSLGQQLNSIQNIAIGALGGSFLGSLAKDVAATADEFNNLQARVKLVTGEGQSFSTAWEGVQAIALRTNSELEGTATLFTRIAQAGKELGLSQQAALRLTETINQSIQLSGGSADSAKAAIIQLVQGLQSGVLRGEEFNSIMEQSPRLSRALADGLGVTTGALRQMANQGQLTTEVVLTALQGQAQAVATEFDKLPPTVGRALQNLSTGWTLYVGEVDKATGASTTAASAINLLAQNLSTIGGLLLDAGQAAAAFVALRLAQTFIGISTAAQAAAVQVAASTTALSAAGAAGTAAATGIGRFAAILSTLKTFSLLGIITNFQDIGTWIGESAAKLAGYKDGTAELARAEAAAAQISQENVRQKAALAQAVQLAADKSRGLTAEARALVGEFEKLRTGGKGVSDSLEDIGKKANLADTKGIQAFSLAMRDLGTQGKASGDQIRQAFANALKGEDLATFEVRARLALSGTKNEAEQLATVLDASLREAIRRSGTDFAVISGGMGAAARSAINDTELIINNLDRLKAQGADTAAALVASIGRGIATADSQAAIQALREQVDLVRKALGDKVADGLLSDIEDRARRVISGLGAVADAFKTLGIVSRQDLQRTATEFKSAYETVKTSGQATAEGLQAAFKKYAEAAIAANGGVATEALKSEAAMRGLEVVTDSAGKAILRAMGKGQQATGEFNKSLDESKVKVQEVISWIDRLAKRNAEVKSSMVTDKDGFSADSQGNRISMGGDLTTLTGITNFLKSAGLSEEQAKRLAVEFSDGKGNIPYFSNPGQIKYGGRSSTMSEALLKAAERTTFGLGSNGAAGIGRTVNVNLNTGGRSQTVRTDEDGARAIVETLQRAGLSAAG